MPDPKDLQDELIHRQFVAQHVVDQFTGRRTSYAEWKNDTDRQQNVLANRWDIVWPDKRRTWGDPYVPNVPRIAVEDRTRLVAAGNPSIRCVPETLQTEDRNAAEKRERILGGWWERSRVRGKVVLWAPDLMVAGLSVVKVFVDLSLPKAERFPEYCYVNAHHCYPGPMFTEGPFVDDMLVSYRRRWREVAREFDRELELAAFMGQPAKDTDEIQVIEYGDADILAVVAYRPNVPGNKEWEWLIPPVKHKMGKTPYAIGVRPSPLHLYEGDFTSVLGPLRTWNRMVAMSEDAAIDRTYPIFVHHDVVNPGARGPDADLELENKDARAEFVQVPGEPFSNIQLIRQMGEATRAGALLPPARTGDPNESIISAAGISAANSQMADHVRSLQRDSLAPMLECANWLAFAADSAHGDVSKEIYGYSKGQAYRETYKPSKDIADNYRNQVVYGAGSGLDEVNQSVLVSNQLNARIITRRKARELSPYVENPEEMEKEAWMEAVQDAILAGIIVEAQRGTVSSVELADFAEELQKPGTTLHEALKKTRIAAPMAQPPGVQPTAGPSGVPGAAAPENSGMRLPPLEEVMAGARP